MALPKPLSSVFDRDDFFELYEHYFKPIVLSGEKYFAPAGINNIHTHAAKHVKLPAVSTNDIVPYYNDPTATISPFKTSITNLMSLWDNTEYSEDNITLCPSITCGSLIVLDALKELGFNDLVFETPCYYATKMQAEQKGFNLSLVPTYYCDNFRIVCALPRLNSRKKAFWITQPRISLGLDQNEDDLRGLASQLAPGDAVVIDEATELNFPGITRNAQSIFGDQVIIKLRSIFKGLGINGPRIAVIIHPCKIKNTILNTIWLNQGGIDAFSLQAAKHYADRPNQFSLLLNIAREQTIQTQKAIAFRLSSKRLSLPDSANGYTSALAIDLSEMQGDYSQKRRQIIESLAKHQIIATLGASMFFAHDDQREFIRINYFVNNDELFEAVRRIATQFP